MANPFNELFQMVLEGGVKNGGNGNGLKIREHPRFQEAAQMLNEANFQRNDAGELILDTADKTLMYQNMTALSGSVQNEKNIFYQDVPFLQDQRRIRNVNKFGESGYGKNKVAWKIMQSPSQVQFNTKSLYDKALKEMRLNRDYTITKPRAIKEVNDALIKFGAEPNSKEFIEFQQWNKRTVEAKIRMIEQMNLAEGLKGSDPRAWTLGHVKPAKLRGPMVGSNLYPQRGGPNFKDQAKQDIPDEILDILGVDTSWEIAVGKFLGAIPLDETQQLLTNEDWIKILDKTISWESALQARRRANS